MKKSTYKMKAPSYGRIFTALCAGFLCMLLSSGYSRASDCEILEVSMYETEQDVIVTDWYKGIAYRKYQTEVYPCAHTKVRSNYEMSISTQDIEITATFTDRSTATKKFGCEERRLEYGEEYSCGVCFESMFPIDSLECTIK
jgi:hypothetical protein